MREVGRAAVYKLASPSIESPHQFGILSEGARCGKLFCTVVLPQAARAAESGHTAFSGYSCAGEYNHRFHIDKVPFRPEICHSSPILL